jgi:L-seryl-tRNA(Ser) seleniumtransferase
MARGNRDVFGTLGVSPVINCCGTYTDLGGSILSPSVWRATEELNGAYVRMPELLDATGSMIAELVGAEAARVTPGASAAIALAVAACMTGAVGRHWEQLPDTTGLKDEAVIAAHHLSNYKYAVCARMPGARLVPAGDGDQLDVGALLDAIGERTACVFVPAHLLDEATAADSLRALSAGARARKVPVVVDAAFMVFPVEQLRLYHDAGADLVCVSAKYFGGPNSGGFVAGRADLIDIISGLDFTHFESGPFKSFGRPFKMSRYDVAATALALQEWVDADHGARLDGYRRKVDAIASQLPFVEGVTAAPGFFTMSEEIVEAPVVNCLVLTFSQDAGSSPRSVERALLDRDPIIATIVDGARLILAVDSLLDGQEDEVALRLRTVLVAESDPAGSGRLQSSGR